MNYWVSIDDRLPARGERVLFIWNGKRMLFDCYYDHDSRTWKEYFLPYEDKSNDFIVREKVTHWIPFPRPPQQFKRYIVIAEQEYHKKISKHIEKKFVTLDEAVRFLVGGIGFFRLYDIMIVDIQIGREVSMGEMEKLIEKYSEKMFND